MKKFIIYYTIIIAAVNINAQQDYQITHYMFDNLSFNPGYAGMNKNISATMIGRQQWSGFAGSPTTALINIHAPVSILRGGLGLTYVSDQLGFEKNSVARLNYSYHLGIGAGQLGIGVSAGIIQKSIAAQWKTPSGNPWSQDNSIKGENMSGTVPDINIGLFYKTRDLYFGFSTTHLGGFNMENLNIQNVHHYWVTAGYDYELNADLKLRPSLLIKSDASSSIMDININALFKNMVWGGLTYRFGDEIAPMLGYQHPFTDGSILRVGYAYGITTSVIGNYSNGSHDIMLNYSFKLTKPAPVEKSKNPRFL
ncbi:type IX secretion system membrane protein PorP/SprF [bacterium]|jgi:type IX secretion system PorP/SprF family membrane protein|nr:type IX secretion system membrane protein PorP/SprF [bacterium]